MDKAELVRKLADASHWEDDFISKYDSETVWELLKTLPKDKYSRIRALLGENIADTRKHSELLNRAISILEGKHG